MKHQLRLFISILIVCCLGSSCLNNEQKLNEILSQGEQLDTISRLDIIKERGYIVATTDYNSTNYFIYRGEPMGYQYEMLKLFAEHLGVKLELRINNDIDESFSALETDICDLVALGLTRTRERAGKVEFTDPFDQTRQVLVQRKPLNWRKMKTMEEVESHLIRNPLDLAGKKVYVQKQSSFAHRLRNLSDEIGDTIYVLEDERKEVEELIADVANGFIEYTVSDEHVALVNQKYYPELDVSTPISFPQNMAWAVKKGNVDLRDEINKWIKEYNATITSRLIYNKYFKNPRSVRIANSEYHSIGGGKLSQYDEIIQKICSENNWDWRLLASLIYQESGFRPNAVSWVGAFGLMQLMPSTAESYGVDTTSTPEEQIRAGVKFIKWLDRQLPEEISDSTERTKFILAAYNAGIAHVFDARRLAEKYGKNPNVWTDNTDYYLLHKSNPKYFRDSVVYYGYCRGEETYNFVTEILDRYDHYRNILPEY